MNSVLRPWVTELSLQMQGTLLTAIRGPDNEAKESPSKAIVRAYRCVILNNARNFEPGDKFMGDGSGIPSKEEMQSFFSSIDQYPFHWFMHFLHSAEIIGYEHPNPKIATCWSWFYATACNALHLVPENRTMLQVRLSGDGATEKMATPCACLCFYVFGVGRCANCLAVRWEAEDCD